MIKPVRSALVVGGGLAGMTAALHLADGGVPVHLVERRSTLGGNALRLGAAMDGTDIAAHARGLAERVHAHTQSHYLHRHRGWWLSAGGRATGWPCCAEATVRRSMLLRERRWSPRARRSIAGLPMAWVAPQQARSIISSRCWIWGSAWQTNPTCHSSLKQVVFISCVGPWDEPNNRAFVALQPHLLPGDHSSTPRRSKRRTRPAR